MTLPVQFDSADFFADPYRTWRWLRKNDPVHQLPNGALLLTRHDDVVAALADPLLVNRQSRFSAIGPRHRANRTSADVAANVLPFMDGAAHRDRRRLLADIVRNAVTSFEARMIDLARQQATEFVQAGGGDVLSGFATPYSLRVMTEMFGLDADDGPDLARWSDAFFRLFAPAVSRDVLDQTDAALSEARTYFMRQISSSDRREASSILAGLRGAVAVSGGLSELEAADAAMLIFADGIENVDALLASAILALRDSPDWKDRLLADPSHAAAVIEETLRYDPPGQVIARIAAQDCEIAGRPVRAEMPVLLSIGSANRDEATWEGADRFDPARRQMPVHLAFGAGKHGCLGARLVRMKAGAALSALVASCRDVSIATQAPSWEPRFGHRWLEALEVVAVPR